MSRRIAFLACAALLLPRLLAAQPAAGGPTTAGTYAAPVAAGGATFLWNPDGLFRIRPGSEIEEITGSEGEPLRSVRGLAPGRTARDATWVWTDDRLLSILPQTTAAVEIERVPGLSLTGIRGATTDEAGGLWAWSDFHLYLHRSGTTAQLVTRPGDAFSLSETSGAVSVPQGVLVWGGEGVFRVRRRIRRAEPIPAPGGDPIRTFAIGALVVSGGQPRVWNQDGAWDLLLAFDVGRRITDASGVPLTGIRGMAAAGDGPAWLWNAQGLFGVADGPRATEVLELGRSVAGVRGVVYGPAGVTWFWTSDHLFALQPGSFTAAEVTAPDRGPIRGVQGLVAGAGGTLLWTRNRVLELSSEATSTLEITAPDGRHLVGARGVVEGPGRTVLWTDDAVLVREPASPTTVEVTSPGGGPIANAWGAALRPDGGDVWIRNHATTYVLDPDTTTAAEVRDPHGRSIPSPPYNLPLASVAITRTTGAGVGATASVAPGVTFGGSGASGGVLTGSPFLFPPGPSPVIAGGGFQTLEIGSAWTVVSAAGAAVLSTGTRVNGLGLRYETRRASADARAREGDGPSGASAVSHDGRYTAFGSEAANLVEEDTNGVSDVFLHDRLSGATLRAAPPGAEPDGASVLPAISADGGHVSFSSAAVNLVDGDTNGRADAFVWTRKTGAVERVSLRTDGAQAQGGASSSSAISADGRFVAFDSSATNLVAGDTNGVVDVFVRDRAAGATERISVSSAGAEADGPSSSPSISADGRFVAFVSTATRLVPGDTNGEWDVFVHDRLTGATERVSVSSEEGQQDDAGPSLPAPRISAGGHLVAFHSRSPHLVAGDTNGSEDVFVRDRAAGTSERVSLTGRLGELDGPSRHPSLSADGRFVAFASEAPELLGPGVAPGPAVFVRDRVTATTRAASRTFLDSPAARELGGDDPSLSGDGRYVAFSSAGETRGGVRGNGIQDVFVRDMGAADAVFPLMVDGGEEAATRSDAFIHNPGDVPLVLDLTFFKRGLVHPEPPVEAITVGAHETVFLEDLLPDLLGVEAIFGAVEVDRVHPYSDVEPVATFQIRNAAPGGGFYSLTGSVQPLTGGDRAASRVQTQLGLSLVDDRLSFVSVHTVDQDAAVYDLTFFDRLGNPVGEAQRALVLEPGQQQVFGVDHLSIFGLRGLEDLRVEVTTTSGGPVHGVAFAARPGSGDWVFIPPAAPGRSRVHLLGALATAGGAGNRWTTDAVLYNPAPLPAQVRMRFTPAGRRARSRPLGPPVTLAPGETLRLRDVLQSRGVSAGVGAISIESDGTPVGLHPIVTGEAIETSSPGRSFGRFLPAIPDDRAADEGERSILVGLRQNADHRTTLWLFNPSGFPGAYDLRYRGLDGRVLATSKLALGGGKLAQVGPGRLPEEVDGLRAFTVEVSVRRGRLLAAAAVADELTGDPVTVIGETR